MFKNLIAIFFIVKLGSALFLPTDRPDVNNAPLMARYIIHEFDWVAISTISTQEDIKGYPFVGLKSISDGPVSNGTGVPYLYLTDNDISVQDLQVDDRCTLLITEAQSDYCTQNDLDQQDPRCGKVILSGSVVKVDNSSSEYEFGKQALFERHPEMQTWPADHGFYVAKLNITKIQLFDFIGGVKLVNIDEYFKVELNNTKNVLFENVDFDA